MGFNGSTLHPGQQGTQFVIKMHAVLLVWQRVGGLFRTWALTRCCFQCQVVPGALIWHLTKTTLSALMTLTALSQIQCFGSFHSDSSSVCWFAVPYFIFGFPSAVSKAL